VLGANLNELLTAIQTPPIADYIRTGEIVKAMVWAALLPRVGMSYLSQ
jgi:hypothetical protein